ncbi:T9SS type A sorting domain-containing protein [Haliscomenobacter sp.]|uniref:T9SS type A sorting domain-containing protein n=1 Tax=Haliscomenobacter sp. TaxID=2717303 RepID=UPI003BAC7C48
MKKILFILLAGMLAPYIRGQGLERSVLGAAGKTDANKTFRLEWTLGEVAVSRYEHPDGEINEGFHQPYLSVEPDQTLTTSDQRFQIYPNPVSADLFVKAKLRANEQVRLRLIDPAGRLLLPDRLTGGLVDEQLDLQRFPAGHYYLLVLNAKGKVLQSAKILKQ